MSGASAHSFVGVLMLDTRFVRLPGDIGHPATFERAGIPVAFDVVRGATPGRVVQPITADTEDAVGDPATPPWLAGFVAAARGLEARGAVLVTTSCGFLAAHQQALQLASSVPLLSSSLLLCRRFARPGIVTIAAHALTPPVLAGAGVVAGTPIEGVDPRGAFARRILADDADADASGDEADIVAAARALVARHPHVEDIVLECTNMPPHRDAVVRATGRRVHDIETLVVETWRRQGHARGS
jgi:hypothetical protein